MGEGERLPVGLGHMRVCGERGAPRAAEVVESKRLPRAARWNSVTCDGAAGGGHLELLQWARANGCDWNSGTCYAAAEGGHLEVLQWARANGCPWDSGVISCAEGSGRTAVAEWARANGCPEPSSEEEQSDDY